MSHTCTNDDDDREQGSRFAPRFDAQGLISAIVVDAANQQVLMFAFMNADALRLTRETGFAHFWSRSRQGLWKKGETSGNTLKVVGILVDCDQDALVVSVEPQGPACHTGETSCFYRRLEADVLVKVRT
ncbi:MAG: phosphoribosyl-AMP cyclohydrolase [Sphingomonadales bacterium BRH_c42]|nr:MAG: phosphoribosyl-AMP cyclohydrolase [Sphingomonadales bacterium BRH_c42]